MSLDERTDGKLNVPKMENFYLRCRKFTFLLQQEFKEQSTVTGYGIGRKTSRQSFGKRTKQETKMETDWYEKPQLRLSRRLLMVKNGHI